MPAATVFGEQYSALYDHFYHDKDYAGECDLLEQVFAAHGSGRVRDVLDLGCGTGGHAWILARRGYRMVGLDRSATMVGLAQEKAETSAVKSKPESHQGDWSEVV